MKITAIEIVGFGKWQQLSLDFSDHNQLLYGANEVGKSTIYQFIQTMLFGFSNKSKRRRDLAPKNGGPYGGRLWFWHPIHGEVQIERFKDQLRGKAKVYLADGTVGDEDLLAQLLKPLTRELFQEVFTFQQEQLHDLGHLTEEGLETSLLALGLAGSQKLLLSRERNYQQAQGIYKGKGSQPPLNQKLLEWQALSERVQEKEQQEDQFQQVAKHLQETQKELQQTETQLEASKQQQLHLEKIAMNLPLYEEYQALLEEVPLPAVSEEMLDNLQQSYQEYQFLSGEAERLDQELEKQSGLDENSARYYFYLEHEEEIKAFLDLQVTARTELAQLEWLQQDLAKEEQRLLKLENRWQWQEQEPPVGFSENELLDIQTLEQAFAAAETEERRLLSRIAVLKDQISQTENMINELESSQPALVSSTTTQAASKLPAVGLLVGGLILCVLGIILSGFLRIPLLVIGVALAVIGGFLFTRKPTSNEEAKLRWQELLSQLDHLQGQLVMAEEQLEGSQQQLSRYHQQFVQITAEKHLGSFREPTLWLQQAEEIDNYRRLLEEQTQRLSEMTQIKNRLRSYQESAQFLENWLALGGKSVIEVFELVASFAEEMEKVRFAQTHQASQQTRQAIKEVKRKQKELQTSLQPTLEAAGLSYISDVPSYLQKAATSDSQERRKQELAGMLAPIFAEKSWTTAQVDQELQQLAQTVTASNEQLRLLQADEQKLLYQCKQMTVDGTLDELYQQQAGLLAEIKELAIKWGSLQLASQLLMDLLNEMSEQQLPQLLAAASSYFQTLTGDNYERIQVADDSLEVQAANGTRFLIHELSTGTRDQLILAIRFGFISLQGSQLCPVIIDDGWLHYDHERKAYLVELLADFGQRNQVICFSSDLEMVSYYQERNQSVIDLEKGAPYEKIT